MKSVAEQYQEWARQAVDDWDGVNTTELFLAILERTGEDEAPLHSALNVLHAARKEAPGGGAD